MNKHQEIELQLDRTKLELTEKSKVLNKTRDKLTQMKTQFDQATAQVRYFITHLLSVLKVQSQY